MKAFFALLSILLAAPIAILAHPPALWVKCAPDVTCYKNEDCQQAPDCISKSFHHSPGDMFCGGVFEPHTCWVYTKWPGY
ncbi:hypothetical protein I7I50_08944 [Histoplasma capsulatum G186AR]|uniref:Uncharacterized protein n=1 Tax=Ajellomyces capsulatus TaxID=5037 RepID=A0A8H8CZA9_AJECA|nr:hypothetical protein I7I52_06460 [Histoplasma capsulatum]QSS73979.1 hypothetical protein I7I50_08944 [Histoplasma capsulatum G186AR]